MIDFDEEVDGVFVIIQKEDQIAPVASELPRMTDRVAHRVRSCDEPRLSPGLLNLKENQELPQ
jgi:hypothetical protein